MSAENQVERNFRYYEPTEQQIEIYQNIRTHGRVMGHHIVENCPESRERYVALTKLEEVIMWANASVARPKD